MGKKPVVGLIGLCWAGIALAGCAGCCNSCRNKDTTPSPYKATPAFSTTKGTTTTPSAIGTPATGLAGSPGSVTDPSKSGLGNVPSTPGRLGDTTSTPAGFSSGAGAPMTPATTGTPTTREVQRPGVGSSTFGASPAAPIGSTGFNRGVTSPGPMPGGDGMSTSNGGVPVPPLPVSQRTDAGASLTPATPTGAGMPPAGMTPASMGAGPTSTSLPTVTPAPTGPGSLGPPAPPPTTFGRN
jgi:hypothetical protein